MQSEVTLEALQDGSALLTLKDEDSADAWSVLLLGDTAALVINMRCVMGADSDQWRAFAGGVVHGALAVEAERAMVIHSSKTTHIAVSDGKVVPFA